MTPWRNTKLMAGLEHHSNKKRLSKLRLFSMEKKCLWGDLIKAFQYLEGA